MEVADQAVQENQSDDGAEDNPFDDVACGAVAVVAGADYVVVGLAGEERWCHACGFYVVCVRNSWTVSVKGCREK